MKLKVFTGKTKPEKEVFFKLEQDGNSLCLIAVDKEGIRLFGGDILTISEKGIHLCDFVGDFGIARLNSRALKLV